MNCKFETSLGYIMRLFCFFVSLIYILNVGPLQDPPPRVLHTTPLPFASERVLPYPNSQSPTLSPTYSFSQLQTISLPWNIKFLQDSPTEARQGRPLLHMYWKASYQPLYALWLVAYFLGAPRSPG